MSKQGRCPKEGPPFDPPKKDHHMEHFEDALEDALDKWQAGQDPAQVKVTFTANVAPNPGGIKEYFATISPAG